jgi:hypothetical protein
MKDFLPRTDPMQAALCRLSQSNRMLVVTFPKKRKPAAALIAADASEQNPQR